MQHIEVDANRSLRRDFEPYTASPSFAPRADGERSLADRIGGEPYPSHPTRWYEWLAAVLHLALLGVGVACLLLA